MAYLLTYHTRWGSNLMFGSRRLAGTLQEAWIEAQKVAENRRFVNIQVRSADDAKPLGPRILNPWPERD